MIGCVLTLKLTLKYSTISKEVYVRECDGCPMYGPETVCPIVDNDYCPCRNCLIKVVCINMCFDFSTLIEPNKEVDHD